MVKDSGDTTRTASRPQPWNLGKRKTVNFIDLRTVAQLYMNKCKLDTVSKLRLPQSRRLQHHAFIVWPWNWWSRISRDSKVALRNTKDERRRWLIYGNSLWPRSAFQRNNNNYLFQFSRHVLISRNLCAMSYKNCCMYCTYMSAQSKSTLPTQF